MWSHRSGPRFSLRVFARISLGDVDRWKVFIGSSFMYSVCLLEVAARCRRRERSNVPKVTRKRTFDWESTEAVPVGASGFPRAMRKEGRKEGRKGVRFAIRKSFQLSEPQNKEICNELNHPVPGKAPDHPNKFCLQHRHGKTQRPGTHSSLRTNGLQAAIEGSVALRLTGDDQ